MKQVGKLQKSLLLSILAIALMLTGCVGLQDWIYDDLPNGYEICHLNTQNICLNDSEGRPIIKRYIMEFCYNDSYIGAKQLEIDDKLPAKYIDIDKMDKSNPNYYLMNTETEEIMGPYTAEEYESQLTTLEIKDMCDWIKTVPRPEGAK